MRLSREVEALVAYMAKSGVPHRVTSTTGDKHAANSRHYAGGTDGTGLAVDFAGPKPNDTAAMLVIFAALAAQAEHLHELIFWDGGAKVKTLVRRGALVVPAVYANVLPAHRNHVHVSVDKGTFLEWPTPEVKEVRPVHDPPLQLVDWLECPAGGTWLLFGDGGVGPVGGAPALGQPLSHDYWGNRKAAKIVSAEGGYRVQSTTGEWYGPNF